MTFTNTRLQYQPSQLDSEMDHEIELQNLFGNNVSNGADDGLSNGVGQMLIAGFWGGIFAASVIVTAILTYTYAIGVPFIQS